jgi:hypothetical protein
MVNEKRGNICNQNLKNHQSKMERGQDYLSTHAEAGVAKTMNTAILGEDILCVIAFLRFD